ncbi:MAG: urease accessory protein [Bacteroidota bacterium]
MEEGISLAFALFVGFAHAFEADHLLAVSTLISRSKSTREVASSGLIWGLGHTSTIFFIGLLFIVFNVQQLKTYFDYFEILVGIMLIALGIFRMIKMNKEARGTHEHREGEAYSIGLIHGLAGSGGLILLVMADLNSTQEALTYLALFGLGSALGMSVAASLLRLPLFEGNGKPMRKKIFSLLSSLLCIGYGISILLRFT